MAHSVQIYLGLKRFVVHSQLNTSQLQNNKTHRTVNHLNLLTKLQMTPTVPRVLEGKVFTKQSETRKIHVILLLPFCILMHITQQCICCIRNRFKKDMYLKN